MPPFRTLLAPLLLCAASASAQLSWTPTFVKVIDTDTWPASLPFQPDYLGSAANHAGELCFRVTGAGGDEAIVGYLGGSLAVLVQTMGIVPGVGSTFTGFAERCDISHGDVAYIGYWGSQGGVFTTHGGLLPNSLGSYTSGEAPSMDAPNVVFRQSSSLCLSDAITTTVLASTSTIPSNSTSRLLRLTATPSISGSCMAFRAGNWTQESIYTIDGTTLDVIADLGSTPPANRSFPSHWTGSFTNFGAGTAISGQRVAFTGHTNWFDPAGLSVGGAGVFLDNHGTLKVIADLWTQTPHSTDTFSNFAPNLSISGHLVAFEAGRGAAKHHGIYLWSEAANASGKILEVGDVLDGRAVSSVLLDPNGLSANVLALRVGFGEGSLALYVCHIP